MHFSIIVSPYFLNREKTMNQFTPKFFDSMKHYSASQFARDVISGIIVAIIALPLSIALALASGVGPEEGIYTAIFAGFIISFLGGSTTQIAGPTAAFATIVAGIVFQYGKSGLMMATIMAGIFLIIMGFLKVGSLIKFIPYTITVGFTFGIAVTILAGQLKDFFGLTYSDGVSNIETIDKIKNVFVFIKSFNYQAFIIGMVALLIQICWPKKLSKIPSSLIAVIVTILMVKFIGSDGMNVETIGDKYTISNKFPLPSLKGFDWAQIPHLIKPAITIAVLAAIESLLSCVVSDGMTGDCHKPNAELIGQGAGNIMSALFGGIPATGAIARTAANIKNGGRTPVAGMVHSITLVLILVLLMPLAGLIPMPTIAAILFMVAYNMSGWRTFVNLCKIAPKSDILVLVVTFVLTVVFDLVVAIEAGFLLSAVLFLARMSKVTQIKNSKFKAEKVDQENDSESIKLKNVPSETSVYEITGPMFFAAADKFMQMETKSGTKSIIIRMRSVPAMDMTALRSLKTLTSNCSKTGITVILSHVNEQPLHMMKKAGFDKIIGEENFCANIDEALKRAEEINKTKKS